MYRTVAREENIYTHIFKFPTMYSVFRIVRWGFESKENNKFKAASSFSGTKPETALSPNQALNASAASTDVVQCAMTHINACWTLRPRLRLKKNFVWCDCTSQIKMNECKQLYLLLKIKDDYSIVYLDSNENNKPSPLQH